MVISWMVIFWEKASFHFNNENKKEAKYEVGNIADYVIEITKNPEWSGASEIMEA